MAKYLACSLRPFTATAMLAALKACCLGLLTMMSVMGGAQVCGVSSSAVVDWSQYRFLPCHTAENTYQSVLSPATVGNLQLQWKFKTGFFVDSSPSVVNNIMYVGSADGNLYALNAHTGAQMWKSPVGQVQNSSPAVVDGIVYIGSYDYNLYALNATTGAFKWKYTTGSYIDSSPEVVNGFVYFGSWDGYLYCLDATTGAYQWKYKTSSQGIGASPAIANGMVYIGAWDGNLYALDAGSGTYKWKYTTGSHILSSPAVANGFVYVGSDDGYLYALDAGTGAFKWSFTKGLSFDSSPAVANGIVYAGDYWGRLYALNATTGVFLWKYLVGGVIVTSSPAVSNGVVYAASYFSGTSATFAEVDALDAGTGTLLWKYTLGSRTDSSPAVSNDGWVYIGSKDGNVYAFKPVMFNNLGPPGQLYQCNGGWTVTGSTSALGQSYTQASEFTAGLTGSVSQIDVGVTYLTGANEFYAALFTDSNGLPGAQLARWDHRTSNTNFGTCNGLVTITGITGVSLTAGQSYFLVIGPENFLSDTWEVWNYNNTGRIGLQLYSNDDGQSWNSDGQVTIGAFDIL